MNGSGCSAGWLQRVGLVASYTACAQPDPLQPRKAPFFVSLHMGSGAGLVALCGGVQLARQRLEPEILIGYVPAHFSGKPLTVFTFKTSYLPVRSTFGSHWRASAGVGGYVSYTHGATIRDSKYLSSYKPGYH